MFSANNKKKSFANCYDKQVVFQNNISESTVTNLIIYILVPYRQK